MNTHDKIQNEDWRKEVARHLNAKKRLLGDESIVEDVIGYAINSGGPYGLTTESAIFAVFSRGNGTSWVLMETIDRSLTFFIYQNEYLIPNIEKGKKLHRSISKLFSR